MSWPDIRRDEGTCIKPRPPYKLRFKQGDATERYSDERVNSAADL